MVIRSFPVGWAGAPFNYAVSMDKRWVEYTDTVEIEWWIIFLVFHIKDHNIALLILNYGVVSTKAESSIHQFDTGFQDWSIVSKFAPEIYQMM